MSYEALLRKVWTAGSSFVVTQDAAGEADAKDAADAKFVQAEMEEIVERESWDAGACLTGHREGIMKLAPFVKFREEKFGAVLFETRSEKVFTLTPTGAAVVREVVTGADAKTVIENLKTKFEDPSGKLEAEAQTFIAQLKEKGLITE
jgi:hypothetical protein